MVPLVYNENRSGVLLLNGRRYQFKRSRFPVRPTAEWFAVDFLNNLDDVVDADPPRNLRALRHRLCRDLDRARFAAALAEFGSRGARLLAREHHLLDDTEQPYAA